MELSNAAVVYPGSKLSSCPACRLKEAEAPSHKCSQDVGFIEQVILKRPTTFSPCNYYCARQRNGVEERICKRGRQDATSCALRHNCSQNESVLSKISINHSCVLQLFVLDSVNENYVCLQLFSVQSCWSLLIFACFHPSPPPWRTGPFSLAVNKSHDSVNHVHRHVLVKKCFGCDTL